MFKTLMRPVAQMVRRLTGTTTLADGQAAMAGRLAELERLVQTGTARSDGVTGELLAALPDLRHRLDGLRDRPVAVAALDELIRARADRLAEHITQAEATRATAADEWLRAVSQGISDVLRTTQLQAEASRNEVRATTDDLHRNVEASRSEQRDSFATASRFTAEQVGAVRDELTNTRLGLDLRLGAIHNEVLALSSGDGSASQLGQTVGQMATALSRLHHEFTDLGLDRWKVQELEGLVRYLRRRAYEDDIAAGRLAVPDLETRHPVAVDSDDTKHPWGAVNDNSICPRFNARLAELLGERPQARVLDIGCAGGGFVRSLLDEGYFAVGLDGCDVPRTRRLGEWGTIPHHLFNCDVTRPFILRDRATGEPLRFDAITAWELLEHIPDGDLDRLMANILAHLTPDGYFLCSVSTIEDGNPEVGAVYHVTVQSREWWLDRLAGVGLEPVTDHPIGTDDWVRGSGNCRLDRRVEEEGVGFHLVLRRRAASQCAAA
ncbi:MAG TPA: methyltransferase domain-containing protein [Fimbriiglobus sp.]|nr:methyltransferase domain-containing protein [Fimbriiglobus sp.]